MIRKRDLLYGLAGFTITALGLGLATFFATIYAKGVLVVYGVGVGLLGIGFSPMLSGVLCYIQGRGIKNRNEALLTAVTTGIVGHFAMMSIIFLFIYAALKVARLPSYAMDPSGGASELFSVVYQFVPVLLPSGLTGLLAGYTGWRYRFGVKRVGVQFKYYLSETDF